jgi:hypothetical protein
MSQGTAAAALLRADMRVNTQGRNTDESASEMYRLRCAVLTRALAASEGLTTDPVLGALLAAQTESTSSLAKRKQASVSWQMRDKQSVAL